MTATVPARPDTARSSGLTAAHVREQQHLIATHFSVIEGWLELLADREIDAALRQRAAQVVRGRTVQLRLELEALLHRLDGGC
ncbi:hypothetical protein H5392_00995 [Tessaracoccus sp. MC1865]|uniref:hypothetical protein n=1 Tax=Tessaracoccus sp. MC1865 TaxID=2760310 RepID=UPI0016037EAE|nr:hypothetical protein [Tessaracoccus sp. MC1865]MBB1482436.1 hypothetical protein [Tessaracoccus sp. MC1865]QTO38107.1 hypothetical protein J7D54_03085 [Tessaracoccus sp. MC1865]